MAIYKIRNDYKNYLSLTIKGTELFAKMPDFSMRFQGESRLAEWVAPEVEFYASQNCRSREDGLPDLTTWVLGNLVLNERSRHILQDRLTDCAELLPILYPHATYSMVNILNVLPDSAIDWQQTREVYDGKLYLGLERLVFSEEQISDNLIFKTNADKRAFSYCTDVFKELVEGNGLQGLVFETDLGNL